MVDIETAVMYPMESEDWVKTILIGGILSLLSFLIIPAILLYGYIIQLIRARFEGQSEPLAFDDWGSLFTDGIQAVAIGIIYLLIPAIVGFVTVGGSLLAIATGTRTGAATGLGGLVVGFGITTVLSLVFGYIAVAALLNFADKGEFSAGFDFGIIKSLVLSSDYAIAWVAAIAVFFIASVISGVLNAIPLLGAIVSAFIFFYAQMVAAYLWAGGFVDVKGTPSSPDSSRPTEGI